MVLSWRIIADALTDTELVTIMYGPPQDCKGEARRAFIRIDPSVKT
jgi:hypothetical protein